MGLQQPQLQYTQIRYTTHSNQNQATVNTLVTCYAQNSTRYGLSKSTNICRFAASRELGTVWAHHGHRQKNCRARQHRGRSSRHPSHTESPSQSHTESRVRVTTSQRLAPAVLRVTAHPLQTTRLTRKPRPHRAPRHQPYPQPRRDDPNMTQSIPISRCKAKPILCVPWYRD